MRIFFVRMRRFLLTLDAYAIGLLILFFGQKFEKTKHEIAFVSEVNENRSIRIKKKKKCVATHNPS